MAWSKAYVSKKIYTAYQEIDALFSGLYQAIDLRYQTQAISKLEYNATKNQGRLITLQKQKAETAYQVALQKLNLWISTEGVIYDVSVPSIETFNEALLPTNPNLSGHPLLDYWQTELQKVKAEENVAKAQLLPKFSAQYGFQKNN